MKCSFKFEFFNRFINRTKFGLKKTPKGAPSTDASVLEELAKNYDLPKHILKYRELEKIRSTYVDGLLPEVSNDSWLTGCW